MHSRTNTKNAEMYTKLPKNQQGKIYKVWHPIKNYQAGKEAGNYDPSWGEKKSIDKIKLMKSDAKNTRQH